MTKYSSSLRFNIAIAVVSFLCQKKSKKKWEKLIMTEGGMKYN